MNYENKLKEMIEQKRVVFPLTDLDGRVTGIVGRNLKACAKNVIRGEGFFGDINTEKDTLIIVEGFADVFFTQISRYDNVIVFSRKYLTDIVLERLAKMNKKIILFYDNDELGQRTAQDLFERLTKYGIRVYNYRTDDARDIIEYLQKGKSLDEIFAIAKG